MRAKIPYANPQLHDEHSAISAMIDHAQNDEFLKKLASLKLRGLLQKESGKVSPDTFGCDCLFLESFITEDISDDFPLIVQDFLRHEFSNLSDYDKEYFLNDSPSMSDPICALQSKFLNLMYSAAKQGNEYAVKLFQNLYKTYYRKEYKQLKRFRSISVPEIIALSNDPKYGVSMYTVSRILAVSRLFGIEILPDCSFLYLLLQDTYGECARDEDDRNEELYLKLPETLYQECLEQVNEWMETVKAPLHKAPELKAYRKAETFLSTALRYNHYPSDYAYRCHTAYDGIRSSLAGTLTALKYKYPNESFTFEEVQTYSLIFDCAAALGAVSDDINTFVDHCIGLDMDWFEDFPPMFKPESIQENGPTKKKPAPLPKVSVPAGKTDYETVNLLEEIDSLRRKLHQQEQEIRHARSLYEDARNEKTEITATLRQYEGEHEELVALRNHVYQSTEAAEAPCAESLKHMEDTIAQKRIIIIGGHTNWTYKLKNKFRNWVFLDPKTSGSVDNRLLNHADYVFFFTDIIKHSTYLRFVKIVREKQIPFGYLHSIHIPTNIRQIYLETR